MARIVSAAIEGRIPNGFEGDLVEETPHQLGEVVASMRSWLGFETAKRTIVLPSICVAVVCRLADALSVLGWRSSMRSTAFKVLTEGVRGEPADLSSFGMPPVSAMAQTLAGMPTRVEDRLFARMLLLTPLMLVTLSMFWLSSGVIGLVRVNEATITLDAAGWPHALAVASVVFWAVIDIGIAAAFLIRKYAGFACWAAIAVSIFYLIASSVFVPTLWIDPLGPLLKVFPGIALALVTRVALESR